MFFSHKRSIVSFVSTLLIVTQLLTPLSLFQSVALAAPTLTISKALGSGTPTPIPTGQEFDYVITWGCNGSISPADDCMNLKVTDTLPAGLQYVSTAFSAPVTGVSASGNALTVNFTPIVTAGSIGSFTLRVKFPAGTTPNGITVNNIATIEAQGIPPVTSAPVSITTLATDKTTLTKTVVSNGAVDNLSVYTLNFCPAGGPGSFYNPVGYLFPANFSITDTLPPGATFVSSTPRVPDVIAVNILTWNEPGLTAQVGSNPDWTFQGCFDYQITVSYPSSAPSNIAGASKTNNVDISYTPVGGVPTTKNANATHVLPGALYGPGNFNKTAAANVYVGEEYGATLSISNTGTTTLDYEFIDYIPAEVDIYGFTPNQYLSAASYQKNGVNTWIAGVNVAGPYNIAINKNIPGNFPGFTSGDYISGLKLYYDNVPGGTNNIKSEIYGIVINPDHNGTTYVLPHIITNTGTTNIYTMAGIAVETQAKAANTNVIVPPRKFQPDIIKCAATASGSCIVAPTLVPGNTGYYDLDLGNNSYGITVNEQVNIVNPTYVDLLPAEIDLDNLPADFVYTYAGIVGQAPGNNNCKPDVTVTPNFENNGRTLLMFSWAGKTPTCQIPRNGKINISNIKFKVKIGTPPTTVQNRATMINSENPPTDVKFAVDQGAFCEPSAGYPSFTDDNIILGASGGSINTIPVDPAYLCFSRNLTYINGQTFSVANSFQMDSKKCVKGQLDSQEYCSGDANVARTVRGGNMVWTNRVTNVGNVSVQGLDMIDILPFPGNIGVGNPVNLGSTWQPQFLSAITLSGAPSGTTVYYSTEPNPCRPNISASPGCVTMTTVTGVPPGPGQWSDTIPTTPTTVRSIRINFGSNIIAGGQSVAVSYTMTAPINAPISTDGSDSITATLDDTDVAWNSFGWSAIRLSDSTIQSSAPTRVGIEVRNASGLKLGNYVWHDTNTNGQQDEGSSDGINGVQVQLYSDLDGNIATTGDQTLIGTQFTANDPVTSNPGYYLFQALSAGNYFVRFEPPALYPNASPTNTGADATDSDGLFITGQTYRQTGMYNLTADDLTIDQGFYGAPAPLPAALGNFVWIDTNANGQQDSGETGLNGVTVNLLSSTGLTLATQTTSSTVNSTGGNLTGNPGFYHFSNLSAGTYQVQFVLPSGYTFTSTDTGADATDSDATQTGTNIGKTGTYTLIAGDNNLSVDAGVVAIPVPPAVVSTGSIGDTVWYDANSNGIQEATELGMSGITMTLSGTNTFGDPVNRTMSTNGSGRYLFTNLYAGNYTITTNVGTEYTATYDLDAVSSRNTASTTLAAGQNRLDVDFGYVLPVVVPPPVISTGGGGGSSSIAPVVTTPAPSPSTTQAPPPPKVVAPPKKLVKAAAVNLLRFTLPEKLLDTGTVASKKGIKVIKNPKVDTKSMFSSETSGVSLADASEDVNFWKERLKTKLGKKYLKEEDGNAAAYIVVPTTGIVTPITTILGSKSKTKNIDFTKLVSGKEIQVNPYLHDGVLHYPRSADPAMEGNAIYAGHSSYWSSGLGRYKTVFGNLIELDAGEEVWVYQRSSDGTYDLFRYRVTASYNTSPADVNILLPENGKKLITLFTCTPIGGITGRWVVRGELVE